MRNNAASKFYQIPYLLWIALFVVIPLALIGYYSFFDIEGNFTFNNYVRFFQPIYLKMTFESFWVALVIMVVSLVIAFPTAYWLVRTKHRNLWLMLFILPTWINLLLKTYAFLGIFGAFGTVNKFLEFVGIGSQQLLFTHFSFIFVSVYIFVPFMLLPIYNSLEELNPSLLDAAKDLGADKWTTIRKVILPLVMDGVKSGCQMVFIPALSLFMITRLIAGNKVMTLGTAIEAHFLVTQDWGMGATIAVFLTLAMVLFMFLTGKKKRGGVR